MKNINAFDQVRAAIEYEIKRQIIEESFAKQYLKMICSCIYKKVDESDESKRKEAYKQTN